MYVVYSVCNLRNFNNKKPPGAAVAIDEMRVSLYHHLLKDQGKEWRRFEFGGSGG